MCKIFLISKYHIVRELWVTQKSCYQIKNVNKYFLLVWASSPNSDYLFTTPRKPLFELITLVKNYTKYFPHYYQPVNFVRVSNWLVVVESRLL